MKAMYKVIISFILIVATVQIVENSASSDVDTYSDNKTLSSITLAEGSDDEYVIGPDDFGKIEDSISSEFTQSQSKKPIFSKEKLTSVSFKVGNSTVAIYPMSDGTYLAIVNVENYLTYIHGNAPRIETVFVAKVSVDGEIIASKNIPLNQSGVQVLDDRYTWDVKMHAAYRGSIQSGDTVKVMYDGQRPGADSSDVHVREYPRIAVIDKDLNISYNDINFNNFKTNNFIIRPSQINNEIYYSGFRMTKDYESDTLDVFSLSNDSYFTNVYKLQAPGYEEFFPDYPNGGEFWKQELTELRKDRDGNFIGKVITLNHDTSLRRVMIIGWDSNFNIKYMYRAHSDAVDLNIQKSISDLRTVYFLEDNGIVTNLNRLDTMTGSVDTVIEYPEGTNITIMPCVDTIYDTKYRFYGSISNPKGQFNGYSSKGGAITGSLLGDFSVYNASVVEATGDIVMNTVLQIGDSEQYMSGGLTVDRNYTSPPENGWPDQSKSSSLNLGHAYFGRMSVVEDYSPAIKVEDKIVVNKDEIKTADDWDHLLLENIAVFDTYELSTTGNNRSMEWLRSRININPNDISAPIEWETLGLKKDEIGYNLVKYFITDSSMQLTSISTPVNIIDESTSVNNSKTAAISAHNFSVKRSEANMLTEDLVKLSSNANVYAWDMQNGNLLNDSVTVDKSELEEISTTKSDGVFDLTLYAITDKGEKVRRTVKVFVLGDDDVDQNGIILFSSNFDLLLSDAPLYNNAVLDSQAVAYNKRTGVKLDSNNIVADHTYINESNKVGPVVVNITYVGDNETTTSCIANVLGSDTVSNETYALNAENFVVFLENNKSLTPLAKNLNNKNVLDYANVFAWDKRTGENYISKVEVDKVSLDIIKNSTQHGVYDLSFKLGSLNKSVKVFVADERDVIKNDILLFAENFKVDLSDARLYKNAVIDSKAIAYNIKTGQKLDSKDIGANHININVAKSVGPVLVEIFYENNVRVSTNVIANIINDNVVINDTEAVSATNFVLTTLEVNSLSSETAIKKANAKAWSIVTGEVLELDVDLSNVKPQRGVYDVIFSTKNNTSKTVKAIVLPNPVENELEVISAENFELSIDEVSSLSDGKVIGLANAQAYDKNTLSRLNMNVDYSEIKPQAGSYSVVFKTDKGLSIKVRATVGNNLFINSGSAIAANNITVNESEVKMFVDDRDGLNNFLVTKSKARAWVINDNEELLPVLAESDSIENVENTEEVRYKHFVTSNSPQTLSNEYSSDDNFIQKGQESAKENDVEVHDFSLTTQEVTRLTDYKVLEFLNIEQDENIGVSRIDYSEVKPKQGIYKVLIVTVEGVEKSVNVFVNENRRPDIFEESGLVIFANNYEISEKEIDDLTFDDHVQLADVKVVNKTTLQELKVSEVDTSNLSSSRKTSPVVFVVDDDVASVVELTILPNIKSTSSSRLEITIVSFILLSLLAWFFRRNIFYKG